MHNSNQNGDFLDSLHDNYDVCPNCRSAELFREVQEVTICHTCGFIHFVGQLTIRQSLVLLRMDQPCPKTQNLVSKAKQPLSTS